LAYWLIGLLAYWLIGLLAYWLIGLLAYWLIGKNIKKYYFHQIFFYIFADFF